MAVDVGTAIAYLDLDTSKYESGLGKAKSSLESFMDSSLSATDRINALGTALSSTGSTLTKAFTLPLVAVGTAVVTTASNFDTSMSKVQAVSGATADDMEKLRNKAIQMGNSTKFSAKESADAFTYMAMAGWDAEQMIDGISGIMNLASADGLDLATTSDIVTDALTAFGLQASDSAHFADVLATASSSANTNVSTMGETFKYAGTMAGSLGYSIEDVSVAVGLMANSSIKGSMAGTSLNTIMTRLATNTSGAQDALTDLGVAFYDEKGNANSFASVMEGLRKATADMSQEEKSALANKIAGTEAQKGLLAIINASEKDYKSLTEAINSASEGEGKASEMAQTMMDNLSGSITYLKSALEGLMIKFGEALIPMIKNVVDWFTKFIDKLNELSDEQVEQIVQIGLVVASIGPALIVLGKTVSLVSKLMGVISALANPVGIIITLITTLTAVFVGLYTSNEDFRKNVNDAWGEIKETITNTIEAIQEILETIWDIISPVFDLLVESFNSVKESVGDSFLNLFESLKTLFEDLQPVLELVAEIIGGVLLTAFTVITGTINGFIEALSPIINIVTDIVNIIDDLGNLIVEVFTGDLDSARQSVQDIWDNIQDIFTNAIEAIQGFLDGFSETFITVIDSIAQALGIEGIGAKLEEFKDSVNETLNNVVESVVEWFENIWDSVTEWIDGIKEFFAEQKELLNQGLGYWLGYMLTKFLIWFGQLVVKISEWKTNMVNKAKEMAKEFVAKLREWFTTLPQRFTTWLTDAVNTILGFKDKMKSSGKDLFNSFWDGLKEVWEQIWAWIKGIGEQISGFFSGIINGAKDAINGSHANGLDYVPYNGYVAELHQGERVLTKAENEEYTNGTSSGGDTFIFYSNEKLDEYETAKQMKRAKKELELDFA